MPTVLILFATIILSSFSLHSPKNSLFNHSISENLDVQQRQRNLESNIEQISTSSTTNPLYTGVVAFPNGGIAVYWAGSSTSMTVAFFEANGNKEGHPLTIAQVINTEAAFVVTNFGDLFIGYALHTQTDCYYEIISASGASVQTTTKLTTDSTVQGKGCYAVTGGLLLTGNIAVAWAGIHTGDSNKHIFTKIISSRGTVVQTVQGPLDTSLQANGFPCLSATTSGYIINWENSPNGQSGQSEIYAQILGMNGNSVGSNIHVSSDSSLASYNYLPKVIQLENGEILMTWQGEWQSNNNYELIGKIYSSSGSALTGAFSISSNSGNHYQGGNNPIAALSNGEAVVVWYGLLQGQSEQSIIAQVVSPTGALIGSQVELAQANKIEFPSAAQTELGWVAVWDAETNGYVVGEQYKGSTSTPTTWIFPTMIVDHPQDVALIVGVWAIPVGIGLIGWLYAVYKRKHSNQQPFQRVPSKIPNGIPTNSQNPLTTV